MVAWCSVSQKRHCSDGSISHRSPSWLQKQQPEVFVPILLGQSPLGHQETQRWSSNKRQLCLRSAQLHSLILRFEFAFDSLSFSSGLHLPYSREEVPCTESQRTSLHFFSMLSVLLTDNWNYSNVFKILKREIHHEIAHMTPEKDLKISMWFRYHFRTISMWFSLNISSKDMVIETLRLLHRAVFDFSSRPSSAAWFWMSSILGLEMHWSEWQNVLWWSSKRTFPTRWLVSFVSIFTKIHMWDHVGTKWHFYITFCIHYKHT